MKTREEVARFVERQLDDDEPHQPKGSAQMVKFGTERHHYGAQELRALMDFIYGGEPSDAERINLKSPTKW